MSQVSGGREWGETDSKFHRGAKDRSVAKRRHFVELKHV